MFYVFDCVRELVRVTQFDTVSVYGMSRTDVSLSFWFGDSFGTCASRIFRGAYVYMSMHLDVHIVLCC